MLTGSERGVARLWDAASGKELRQFVVPWERPVLSVAVSPDGSKVLTGSDDGATKERAGRGGRMRDMADADKAAGVPAKQAPKVLI